MRQGCEAAINAIKRDGLLSPDFTPSQASDFLWTMLSVRNWESLRQQRGWTQARAARALGIDQPKVSALMRGRLRDFSTERLIRFLNDLDQEVEIAVRPKAATARGG